MNQTNQEGQGNLQWHAELEAASALCRTRSVSGSGLFRQVSGDHPLKGEVRTEAPLKNVEISWEDHVHFVKMTQFTTGFLCPKSNQQCDGNVGCSPLAIVISSYIYHKP